MSTPVLVTGIREWSRESACWCESMTNIIRKDWSPRWRSPRTRQAEDGLGIRGTPHYFYAMRTEREFGFAVFLFRETRSAKWPEGTDGATPFDSGGLWHGQVRTSHAVGLPEIQGIFQSRQKPLTSWTPAFHEYIATNYRSMDEYIKGDHPSTGTEPIIPGPPNTSRAWTWEVRIPGALMNEGVELLRGFLSEDDRQIYLDWLWDDSALDDSICDGIELWMQDNMTFTPLPRHPSTVAEHALLKVV